MLTNCLPKLSLITLSPLKRRDSSGRPDIRADVPISKRFHFMGRLGGSTGGRVNIQVVSLHGCAGENTFQVRKLSLTALAGGRAGGWVVGWIGMHAHGTQSVNEAGQVSLPLCVITPRSPPESAINTATRTVLSEPHHRHRTSDCAFVRETP